MQKNRLNRFLIVLFMVMLSACSSVQQGQPSEVTTSASNADIFVDPAISRSMGVADRLKLQSLVATAQAQQWTKWISSNTGAHFEFTSLGIYVNSQGQGCRNYKMLLKRRFLENRAFSYTACRDSQGVWQVVKS
jgi:surface antigen